MLKPVILLAEDDPDQSEMLCMALESRGYQVDAALRGDKAYEKLLANQYALVMLDIRMPGLDGLAVLHAYRARREDIRTPVVVVTAFATEADMRRYSAAGADACVSKPYDLDDLLQLVDKLARPVHERAAKHA